MRLIDRLLSRWYVRRSLLDVSIDNTTQALEIIDELKQMRNAVCNQPCIDVSRCDNGCWRARSATRTGPEFVITTDYKQAPCS